MNTFLRLLIGALIIGGGEYLFRHHLDVLKIIAVIFIILGIISCLILWLWK